MKDVMLELVIIAQFSTDTLKKTEVKKRQEKNLKLQSLSLKLCLYLFI